MIQASACVHYGPNTRSFSRDDTSWAFEARTAPFRWDKAALRKWPRSLSHGIHFRLRRRPGGKSADLAVAQKTTGSQYASRSAFALSARVQAAGRDQAVIVVGQWIPRWRVCMKLVRRPQRRPAGQEGARWSCNSQAALVLQPFQEYSCFGNMT